MLRQISLLCRLQCCNLFGINEFRYTKDTAKKRRYIGLSVAWLFVIFIVLFYVTAFSYGMGMLGMAEIIPIYLYAIVSMITLFFSFFKAGSALFSMKSYEMLVSLPFSKAAVIVSRFIEMYLTAFATGLLVMLPGLVVYGIYEKTAVSFYLVSLLAVIFLPMLPLTIASIIGALIKAISSRSRHKSIGETILMVAVILVVLFGSTSSSMQLGQMDEQALRNFAALAAEQIGKAYPPAVFFQNAIGGDMASLFLLIAAPTAVFIIFTAILQKYYQSICMAINASAAKNNYELKELGTSSLLKALWKKEWKRYFASSGYVTNTIVGYILTVVVAVVFFVVGTEEVDKAFAVTGLVQKAAPFLLSMILSMMPITSCAISMEGKNYWMLQTLPILPKEVYKAKILLNLSIGAPFVFVSSVITCVAVKATLAEAFWIMIIPMGYLCFSAVSGLAANLKFPVLNWDNEVRVVKQSASVLVSMLTGILCSMLPGVAVVLLQSVNINLVMAVITAVLFLVTGILYQYVIRHKLP